MLKFKFIVEGSNFEIRLDDTIGKYGFFTTRFVEAENSKIAESVIMNMIREELESTIPNDHSNPPALNVDEVYEIVDFDNNKVPGSGFTWFKED